MKENFSGPEKRAFFRIAYSKPLAYKVCRRNRLLDLAQGYTVNISQNGILCNIKDKVEPGDILWLSFDKNVLIISWELERKNLMYNNGVIGKVERINLNADQSYDVGSKFVSLLEKADKDISPVLSYLKI